MPLLWDTAPEVPESARFTFEDEIGEEILNHLPNLSGGAIMDPTVVVTVRRMPMPRKLSGRQWGDP